MSTTDSRPDHDSNPLLVLGSSDVLGLPVAAYDAGDDVRIEAAKQRDGSTLWAVRRHGTVLAKDGEWEFEPMPSSRDDEFFARCRYATPRAALDALNATRYGRPNVRVDLETTR